MTLWQQLREIVRELPEFVGGRVREYLSQAEQRLARNK